MGSGSSGPAAPRRGIVEPAPEEKSQTRQAWLGLGALALLLALTIALVYALFGTRSSTSEPVSSPSGSPSAASPSPSSDPSPSQSPSATPTETPSDAELVLELNDAFVTVPEGWELYADEKVQDNRRLVRIRDTDTDARLQAVTLTSVTGGLSAACNDLVADQRSSYEGVNESLAASVPVAPIGEAITCAFSGTRASDSVAATVTFMIVRRDSDAHSLVLRATVPSSLPADSTAAEQLEESQCGAAQSFGVPLTRCPAIPVQGDG